MQVDLLRTNFLPPSLIVQEDFMYRSWEDLSLPRRWRQEDCPRLCLCTSLHGGIPEDWQFTCIDIRETLLDENRSKPSLFVVQHS